MIRLLPGMRLPRVASSVDAFAGALPPGLRTGWYLVVLRAGRQGLGWMATLRAAPAGDAGAATEVALVHPLWWPALGLKLGVVFLRAGSPRLGVRLHGATQPPRAVAVRLVQLPRLPAAAGVWLQNPTTFRTAFKAVSGPLAERVRKAVAAAATQGQQMPRSYANWLRLFDNWPEERMDQLLAALPATPRIAALVFHDGAADSPALVATLASLRDQKYPLAAIGTAGPGGAAPAGDYVAVLQAGEVLPRHALLLLADSLGRLGTPALLLSDEDRLLPDGTRADPWFKPEPGLAMMCSGLLSRGIWLIRADLVQPASPWAEVVRLQAWFALHGAGQAAAARRVPHVLTHRRGDAEAAPPAVLAACVDAALRAAGIQATTAPDFPLRLQWHPGPALKVSILVPSRLKGEVQLACLLDVLARTTHPDFEMIVVVTQQGPLDPAQSKAALQLQADPRARVELLRRPRFNYSAANNFAASFAAGTLLCLLNDDVSTLEGDWLERMAAMFSDSGTGVVGAKLYYPNRTTQHGGVIMGLAGLAQHASRFLPQGAPGYFWRGVLDQDLSVVTGACLLVRRELYRQLGGLDESYPTAFNDVDFCLRVRELGHSVVFAGSVELLHHETLSFGHHYAADAAQEALDVRRMQERWAAVSAADPFHNPNLSLAAQAEWDLAYPPRLGPEAGTGAYPAV